ncbi:MAG: alginate export family protein [Nitrospira sp.]|nr:alginate export family protein [Nitrospira sp.]
MGTVRTIPKPIVWPSWRTVLLAAITAAVGPFTLCSPTEGAFELPEGEKITNPIVIGRGIPQKEAYELFDPQIGRNFDIRNLWLRADLRVRPEYRNNVCFGGGIGASGQCNAPGIAPNSLPGSATDQFVQQMIRLGIGYDLSPNVNFYLELIDSRTWGGNGTPVGPGGAGNNGDPSIQTCGATPDPGQRPVCTLGVRAGYMLIRNFVGIQGLGLKAGRQYLVFGDQSLFGHFDWSNTGFSFDGVMMQYSNSIVESHVGWFRTAETDLLQGAAVGSGQANIVDNAHGDADLIIFYNQIKTVPGFLIEPYYIYYYNNIGGGAISSQGLGTPKHGDQNRHTLGARVAMKKGYFDLSSEVVYQFGQMGDTAASASSLCGPPGGEGKCLHISALATRNWIGYTAFNLPWKPRIAFNFDYASGDSGANCTLNSAYGPCKTANTFENFFPTNHIHMGYMDVQAWKNMISFSANIQARPTMSDHIELWYTNLHLANARDNWYRASQGVYVFSQPGNTETDIGDEIDVVWTHFIMNGMVAFQGGYGHLWPGSYISKNLGRTAAGQDWAYVQLWINF